MLSSVAEYSNERINAKEVNASSYVGVDNLLQNKKGKTIASYIPTTGNLTKFQCEDILIGNIRPYLRKIWFSDIIGGTNGDVLVIRSKNNKQILLNRYLYHILSSEKFFIYDNGHAKGAKMPRGNKEAVMNYQFYIPVITEQQRIVEILDRFDTLCNDLSSGIPAEIEARKKQYEYYRDKMLSFKELK